MANKALLSVSVPTATQQNMTVNVLNYVAPDGSLLSAGNGNLQSVTSFPPPQFIYNGSYYNYLKFMGFSGAQTGSVSYVLDVWRIFPPNTVLPVGAGITSTATPSLLRVTLAAGAATFWDEEVVPGGALGSVLKDNVSYGHF